MPLRRLVGAGLWLATTAAATALVWTATSVVAADVTDRPAPVVAHRDVVNALAAPPAGPAPAPSTTTSLSPPTTQRPGPTLPVSRPTPTVATLPSPSTTPAPPPTTPTTLRATTPTTHVAAPPAAAFAPVTATFATKGGVVTVVCTGQNTIHLVSATPADGYVVLVLTSGPQYVGLQFKSPDNAVSFAAVCIFGQPVQGNSNGQGFSGG